MRWNKINYLIGGLLMLGLATPVLAVVMSSTHYQIDRDSLNFTGGLSTSSSYSSEATLGESATGLSTSTTYTTQAGYQQMDGSWLSLTVPASASLLPNINVALGGSASASAAFIVNTNNGSGYTLQLKKADSSPALRKSAFSYFDDYAGAPDYNWTVASNAAEFGFTAEGGDIDNRFRDNGSVCGTGGVADTSDTCWDGTNITYTTIAQSAVPNYPTGATTTVKFKAEVGASKVIDVGAYSADLVIFAYTN